jgi:hypothetical protein
MTEAVRKRYEDGLETLRSIVARTGDARDSVRALIRAAASSMLDALEKDPDADLEGIIEEFRAAVEAIVMENMRLAAAEADDEDDENPVSGVALALTFARVDISAPVQKYATALSQEVKWFVAGGFAYSALRDYLKDPLGFLASESLKPAQKYVKKQTEGRMTLAPVFMDGKRRRSLSEVLGDFRGSVSAVGSGNSYEVGGSAWMLLNYTSMSAYNDALAMKWTNGGAIGYYVYRGSTYDCPICDEQCGWLHPLTDMAIPAHPHCVCITVAAYAGEAQPDFEI